MSGCVVCGQEVEPGLARLGSVRCSSCRAENGQPKNGHRTIPPFRVRVADPHLIDDLETALRLSSCHVEQETRRTLLVLVPHASDAEQARREVRTQLAMWRARSGAHAELLGG
jgi:hypothetical protein